MPGPRKICDDRSVQLRAAGGGDAEGWADVVAAAMPYLVVSAASVRHDLRHGQQVEHRAVALEDDRVVGVCRVRERPQATMVMVQVHPGHRRRGVGTALLDDALEQVPDTALLAILNGDAGSRAAAARWGFAEVADHTISAVEPRTAPPLGPGPATVPLVDLGPRAVWELTAATGADDPSGLSQATAYEQFVAEEWDDPVHRPDLGRAVVEDGVVLAAAVVTAHGERGWNAFTGTRPEARGRGLALRVKTAALQALAQAGVTRCATGNDATNAAMIAINDRLGYRRLATTYAAVRAPGPLQQATTADRLR